MNEPRCPVCLVVLDLSIAMASMHLRLCKAAEPGSAYSGRCMICGFESAILIGNWSGEEALIEHLQTHITQERVVEVLLKQM